MHEQFVLLCTAVVSSYIIDNHHQQYYDDDIMCQQSAVSEFTGSRNSQYKHRKCKN